MASGAASIDHNSMMQRRLPAGLAVLLRPARLPGAAGPPPRLVGWFDTHPEDDERAFTGAWGVHSALPSGTILVSDIERGLFVLRRE
ncbi:MAG: hypothetical protein R2991_10830 [Thermoanaerobaculia bacterium]